MGSRVLTPIRWREDTGWEYRCGDCKAARRASFWPLTMEFWAPHKGMLRCRACWKEWEHKFQSRYRADHRAELRRKRMERYHEQPTLQQIVNKQQYERIKNDPELLAKARAAGREAQARYKARQKAKAAA